MPERGQVVVVGGGFAGVTAARCLERSLSDSWDVFLLTPSNVLTYNPLLAEVVGGALLPGHAAAPIRLMFSRARVRSVAVNSVDLSSRTVRYQGAANGTLGFDHLVLAVGRAANLSSIPGAAEYALPFKTLGDALQLRNTLLWRLEQATLCADPAERSRLLTFVVVGGGFTGVEVAGEILDVARSASRYYRNVHESDVSVVLLHRGTRLLPELSVAMSEHVLAQLLKRGMEVRLDSQVEEVLSHSVGLAGGERIWSGTVIVTVGAAPTDLVGSLALETFAGRVCVDQQLRVRGLDGVWAIGDCARVVNALDGTECPPTAQFAVRQAEAVARNIAAAEGHGVAGAFKYRSRGQLAAIGHFNAVAEMGGMRLKGLIGWLAWRAVYLFKIPTLAAKARVFFQWNWSLLFPRDPGVLDFRRSDDTSNGTPV